jgi:hypothetical protein
LMFVADAFFIIYLLIICITIRSFITIISF